MKRNLLWALLVLTVIVGAAASFHYRDYGRPLFKGSHLTIDGVELGQPVADVVALYGEPDRRGLRIEGLMVWRRPLLIVGAADDRVVAVTGLRLSVDGQVVLQAGDPVRLVTDRLGPPTDRLNATSQNTATYIYHLNALVCGVDIWDADDRQDRVVNAVHLARGIEELKRYGL